MRTVIITGASSGIGRATAHEFAKREQAHLILIARSVDKLRAVAQECETLGASCEIQPCDVVDGEAMSRIARSVGTFDVWINNAGVGAIGPFLDIPLADHHRVIQTNVLGTINGSHAALATFRAQRKGILVNVGSVAARLTVPLISSYVASKFAIRGLSRSIQQDLAVEGLHDVRVCQVNPSVVDTPAFDHAANHTGKQIKMRFPKTTPEHVAQAIYRVTKHPRREVFVGPLAWLGAFVFSILPTFTEWVMAFAVKRFYSTEDAQKAMA